MKLLIIFVLITVNLIAKKDFYYSFVDDNKQQIPQASKDKIVEGFNQIIYIKRLLREGQIDIAYKYMLKFRDQNKIKVLESQIEILYAEILYKRGSKKFAITAVKSLKSAINNSIINQEDLVEAMRLLVQLNIKINKIKDASFYAKSIINNFDRPITKAYGKISLAQIDIHKRRYKKAINDLYKILLKTKDIEIATVVADELYDVYVLNGESDKAFNLASKVLEKNIAYYANDSFLALNKVDKLIRADMPELAVKILQKLLENAKQIRSINIFKFKLANTYMKINKNRALNMKKAKEIYKDLLNEKQDNVYKIRAKMFIDEILMREGIISPTLVSNKYKKSEIMQEKALMQELLNHFKNNEYDAINKKKKVYLKISDITAIRFGKESIAKAFDEILSNMIKYYLNNDKCQKLSAVLDEVGSGALSLFIKDNAANEKFFACLENFPNKKVFDVAYETYRNNDNAKFLFYLEKVAITLDDSQRALKLSDRIAINTNEKIKSDEFLYKFLIYGKLNNSFSMKKFFLYAKNNEIYIDNNKDNPLIIDFYYEYYLYLTNLNKEDDANIYLNDLYEKQTQMDAYVYSPFVEMQISLNKKLDDDYEGALEYLRKALANTRKIKENDLVQIYYEMSKIYKTLGKENRYKDVINKCQKVENVDSIYKKLCDKL